jgi:extracellular elastinolytic metalloproteinase
MQYSAGSQVSLSEELHPLPHLLSSNCAPKPAPFAQVSSGSPEEALLRFMAEATPNEEVVQDIAVNYEKHLKGMMTSMHTNLVDGQEQPFFMIENVPDAVNPVKARLAYVQVPNGKETQLALTYKVSSLPCCY